MSSLRFDRRSSNSWASKNPILGRGEPGYDTTNKRLKIGDGVATWNNLPYFATADESLSIQESSFGLNTNNARYALEYNGNTTLMANPNLGEFPFDTFYVDGVVTPIGDREDYDVPVGLYEVYFEVDFDPYVPVGNSTELKVQATIGLSHDEYPKFAGQRFIGSSSTYLLAVTEPIGVEAITVGIYSNVGVPLSYTWGGLYIKKIL